MEKTGLFYSASVKGFYDTAIHGNNMPVDVVQITKEEHAALLNGQSQGKIISSDASGHPILVDPPAPTTEQIIARYERAVQRHLDDFANTRGYDSIMSAATYATSTVTEFAAEGQYAIEARDATWAKFYEIIRQTIPKTLDDLIAQLPELAWKN